MSTKEHRPLVADRTVRLRPEELEVLQESGIEEEDGWLVYAGDVEGDVQEVLRADREARDNRCL